jgi:hypothetical protein
VCLRDLRAAEQIRPGEKGAVVSGIGKVELRVCDSNEESKLNNLIANFGQILKYKGSMGSIR